MIDATRVTIYPDETTTYRSTGDTVARSGDRMICAVRVDSVAAIQTNTWEAMQRLVDALTSAITQAKHAEEALALAGLAS